MRSEITRAEDVLLSSEEQTEELKNTQILLELGARLVTAENIQTIHEEVLTAAIAIMHAKAGSVQMLEPATGELVVLATRGFRPRTREYFHRVDAGSSTSCGLALRSGARSYFNFAPESTQVSDRLHVEDGVQSAQSTPLVSRSGKPIGMVSTHWGEPDHRPSERELRYLDLLARQAADLIERQRAETALRESEERQAFLLRLSDALRPLADPEEVKIVASGVLGLHLGVNRAFYAEVDGNDWVVTKGHEHGVAPLSKGPYSVDRSGRWIMQSYRDGKTIVFRDMRADPRFAAAEREAHAAVQIIAAVGVPLIKEARLVGILAVHAAGPRDWKDAEIRLIEETAERTWEAVERAHTEASLRKSEQALRDADRQKDEFLAILSHELRNPLVPLRSGLDALRLGRLKGSHAQAVHAMMERQAGHLVRLVDDLTEISRITRGKLELRRERIELRNVLKSAVEGARPVIEAGGHKLTTRIPRHAISLDADPVRLAQVFGNLLNNAARYTSHGGKITLEARADGGEARIAVTDNGDGIDAAEMPRLFQMFSRGDTAQANHGGLGIGLALARRLVEMHGGTVTAKSAGRGQGSRFVVRLPLATRRGAAKAPRRPGSAVPVAAHRVLVVDDNRDVAGGLRALLKAIGADVQVAHDGQDALLMIDAWQPAMAILDIGMPGMDGYELAREIRRRENGGAHVTLVALTGWGQESVRREAQAAGFDHHIVKPPEAGRLAALLAQVKPALIAQSGRL